MGGRQPRSTAHRPKAEHEMPISYDNPDAHAFWHRVHLAMFAGLPVAFKDAIALICNLFLPFFPPSIPTCWSIYPLQCRSLCFYPGWLLTPTASPPFNFFSGFASFHRTLHFTVPPLQLFLLCMLSSSSVRHKNNRLFLTPAFFPSDFRAHILLQN